MSRITKVTSFSLNSPDQASVTLAPIPPKRTATLMKPIAKRTDSINPATYDIMYNNSLNYSISHFKPPLQFKERNSSTVNIRKESSDSSMDTSISLSTAPREIRQITPLPSITSASTFSMGLSSPLSPFELPINPNCHRVAFVEEIDSDLDRHYTASIYSDDDICASSLFDQDRVPLKNQTIATVDPNILKAAGIYRGTDKSKTSSITEKNEQYPHEVDVSNISSPGLCYPQYGASLYGTNPFPTQYSEKTGDPLVGLGITMPAEYFNNNDDGVDTKTLQFKKRKISKIDLAFYVILPLSLNVFAAVILMALFFLINSQVSYFISVGFQFLVSFYIFIKYRKQKVNLAVRWLQLGVALACVLVSVGVGLLSKTPDVTSLKFLTFLALEFSAMQMTLVLYIMSCKLTE